VSTFESFKLLLKIFLNNKIHLLTTQLCLKVGGPSTFEWQAKWWLYNKVLTQHKEAAKAKLLVEGRKGM
jgi:hypothetical protein